jgi:ribonuclease BN (tRNA processing enzyme)
LAEAERHYIVFDAGFGFQKLRAHIKPDKQVILFISHLHLDHLIGLHTLPLFDLPQGIDICAPQHACKLLRSFLKAPFTASPLALRTKLRFHALDKRVHLPFNFEMRRLRHSVPCYGYRISIGGSVVAYCTDTGSCANLSHISKDADLLITECAMSPSEGLPTLFHLTPEAAARAALGSGVKRLALFHFDPGKYPTFEERKRAEEAAGRIFPETIAANDGTTIYL